MATCELDEAHGNDGVARLQERTSARRGRERVSVRGSGAAGTWPSCPHAGLIGPAVAGVRPPRGGHGLARSATDGARHPVQTRPSGHLTAQVQAISTPNPW